MERFTGSTPAEQARAFLDTSPSNLEKVAGLLAHQLPVDPEKARMLEARLIGMHQQLRDHQKQVQQQNSSKPAQAQEIVDGSQAQQQSVQQQQHTQTMQLFSQAQLPSMQSSFLPLGSSSAQAILVSADSNLSTASVSSVDEREDPLDQNEKKDRRQRKRRANDVQETPAKKISDFFMKSSSPSSGANAPRTVGLSTRDFEPLRSDKECQTDLTRQGLQELADRAACSTDTSAKNATIDELKQLVDRLKREVSAHQQAVEDEKRRLDRLVQQQKELLVERCKQHRREAKEQAMKNRLRLGQFSMIRRGATYVEEWQDGTAFKELEEKQNQLLQQREELRRKKAPGRPKKVSSATNGADGPFARPSLPESAHLQAEWYLWEQEEIIKLREKQLKKEEQDLALEAERLERERNIHIRELKRLAGEDQSRFKDFQVLKDRFLLLDLIGKGGFSEVYKAFDLKEFRYVACKIHQLSREWKEDRKANYLKHAVRECVIHKKLIHPRIVRHYEVFEIDNSSFCTVQEYVDGNDLDFFLKQHKTIGEREARSIIMQVVSALKHMNSVSPPVIHYDLKPGNILLCSGSASGEVKVTDFGLSKELENASNAQDMELTSQGAGTYWYLPPECFVVNRDGPPKISNKVDVWSVGVVLFQCLYGRKPFGHSLSQAAILEQHTILNATVVEFPPKPAVSQEAKNFIRRCLTYHKDERPDVMAFSQDSYLQPNAKFRPSSS